MGDSRLAPLAREERAVVLARLRFWHRKKWQLKACAVKPTHVHVIASPYEACRGQWYSLPEILHSVKRGSSSRINRLRARRGTLWEEESYDHLLRDDRQFERAWNYLLQNAAEEVPGQDPTSYDGYWCESQEGLLPLPREEPGPLAIRPVHPRITGFSMRERNLPHWEGPGGRYHVVISLLGYHPREQWPWAGEERDGHGLAWEE